MLGMEWLGENGDSMTDVLEVTLYSGLENSKLDLGILD
jgi:hypothetical protein